MEILNKIFALKQPLGCARQPSCQVDLERCSKILDDLGVKNPYRLEADQLAHLLSEPALSKGAQGQQANLPRKHFLYRLTYIPSLVHDKGLRWNSAYSPPKVDSCWTTLLKDFHAIKDWVPLDKYASGKLQGFRHFTWWTSLEDLVSQTGLSARRLGLSELGVRGVVLRCSIDHLALRGTARIPTCLDGFFSHLFLPAHEESGRGITLDITNLSCICEGVDEYVMGPIASEDIAVAPIFIDKKQHQEFRFVAEEDLLVALSDFYSVALESVSGRRE